jgi:hypothetical protein
MQIQSINNGQHFGMSLKIEPKIENIVAEKSAAYLDKLIELNEMFKGSQNVDLRLRKDYTPIIEFKNQKLAYSNMYMNRVPKDEFISVTATWEGDAAKNPVGKSVSHVFKLNSKADAIALFRNLMSVKNSDGNLTKMALFAKEFEKTATQKPMI